MNTFFHVEEFSLCVIMYNIKHFKRHGTVYIFLVTMNSWIDLDKTCLDIIKTSSDTSRHILEKKSVFKIQKDQKINFPIKHSKIYRCEGKGI